MSACRGAAAGTLKLMFFWRRLFWLREQLHSEGSDAVIYLIAYIPFSVGYQRLDYVHLSLFSVPLGRGAKCSGYMKVLYQRDHECAVEGKWKDSRWSFEALCASAMASAMLWFGALCQVARLYHTTTGLASACFARGWPSQRIPPLHSPDSPPAWSAE